MIDENAQQVIDSFMEYIRDKEFCHKDNPAVGREAEKRTVMEYIQNHRLAEIVGEPGIGKSTLAREARSELEKQGYRFIEADAIGGDDILAPFVRVISQVIGLPRVNSNSTSEDNQRYLALVKEALQKVQPAAADNATQEQFYHDKLLVEELLGGESHFGLEGKIDRIARAFNSILRYSAADKKIVVYFENVERTTGQTGNLMKEICSGDHSHDISYLVVSRRSIFDNPQIRLDLSGIGSIDHIVSIAAYETRREISDEERAWLQRVTQIRNGEMQFSPLAAKLLSGKEVMYDENGEFIGNTLIDSSTGPRDIVSRIYKERLTDDERLVAGLLSTHQEALSLETIFNMCGHGSFKKYSSGITSINIRDALAGLIEKNFLTFRQLDGRVEIDFENPFIRDGVYAELDEAKKKEFHTAALHGLEMEYGEDTAKHAMLIYHAASAEKSPENLEMVYCYAISARMPLFEQVKEINGLAISALKESLEKDGLSGGVKDAYSNVLSISRLNRLYFRLMTNMVIAGHYNDVSRLLEEVDEINVPLFAEKGELETKMGGDKPGYFLARSDRCRFLIVSGAIARLHSNYDAAIRLFEGRGGFEGALNIAEEVDNNVPEGVPAEFSKPNLVYVVRYNLAVAFYRKAREEKEKARKRELVDKGMDYLIKFEPPSPQDGATEKQRTSRERWLNQRALFYAEKKEYQLARSDADEALSYCKGLPEIEKAFILNTSGDIHCAVGQYNLAKDDYQEALEICDRWGGSRLNRLDAYLGLADSFIGLENKAEAKANLDKASGVLDGIEIRNIHGYGNRIKEMQRRID
ncbi:MAG: AAA family ATPase [Nanoarchaeota archaeon]|nr:AAA family ATPase [Nanoarchaeota archaeon]MBU1946764.1 AAA family ATPase [Nanoarchaeota archaeon]